MVDPTLVERLADLAVRFGCNLQPGQVLAIGAEPGKEFLVRAIAESAYKAGAKFVDVSWYDPWVKRARIQHADPETLDFVPDWYGQRILALGEQRAARVALSGPSAPGLLNDLDPVLTGRDRLPSVKENMQVVNERTTNWTIVPCPTPAWAGLVYPDDDPEGEGLRKLWAAIERVCRLDEADPVAAWKERRDVLIANAAKLTERRFDALRFTGPGTDLTVGLFETGRWMAAKFETADGLEHMPNLPTEEVFTTPHPLRTNGIVRSTKPLVLQDGTVVRDLQVRFEDGRAVSVEASTGGETLGTITGRDEGAARLGEVALVDREGRIGALDTVFYDTLLDENAASHIALGAGFPFLVDPDDTGKVNESEIHIDFMIGADDVAVSGITASGDEVPVLVDGSWQI
jgi:aminopeptidase